MDERATGEPGGPAPGGGDAPPFVIAERRYAIIANTPVNAEYRHLVVAADGAALAARAGQFFHLMCPHVGRDRPLLRRPMSVYRVARREQRVEFLYKVTGAGTRGLASLAPGDDLDMVGPLGRGFMLPQPCGHVLVLARGVGLATLAPLAGLAAAHGAAVTAVLSARAPHLVMSRDAFEAQGARTIAVTDADGSSAPARIAPLLDRLHAERPFSYVATCGSNRLLLLLQDLARAWRVPGEIALEQHMGCGLGMCFCCVRELTPRPGATRYRRVCVEGPVFDLMEALPWST